MGKFYSVYESGTDKPLVIHRTSDECAKALGITRDSFYSTISRQRNGKKPMKYEIFEDEEDIADGEGEDDRHTQDVCSLLERRGSDEAGGEKMQNAECKMQNEQRLIDANALDAKLDELMTRYSAQGRKAVADDYNFVRTVLLTAPTVDAVEVVRCKDCKHYVNYGRVWDCRKYGGMSLPNENDFCSYGERREGK